MDSVRWLNKKPPQTTNLFGEEVFIGFFPCQLGGGQKS